MQFGSSLLLDNNIYRNYAQKGDMVAIPYANLGYGWTKSELDKLFLGYQTDFYLFRNYSHRNFYVHQLGLDYNHLWEVKFFITIKISGIIQEWILHKKSGTFLLRS